MTTAWKEFASDHPGEPAFCVAVLGYWGTYPVNRDCTVHDVGINRVYCYDPFDADAAMAAAEVLWDRSLSVAIYRIDSPSAVNGDTRLSLWHPAWRATEAPCVLICEQRRTLASGITLYPSRQFGQQIECDARKKRAAEKIATTMGIRQVIVRDRKKEIAEEVQMLKTAMNYYEHALSSEPVDRLTLTERLATVTAEHAHVSSLI